MREGNEARVRWRFRLKNEPCELLPGLYSFYQTITPTLPLSSLWNNALRQLFYDIDSVFIPPVLVYSYLLAPHGYAFATGILAARPVGDWQIGATASQCLRKSVTLVI